VGRGKKGGEEGRSDYLFKEGGEINNSPSRESPKVKEKRKEKKKKRPPALYLLTFSEKKKRRGMADEPLFRTRKENWGQGMRNQRGKGGEITFFAAQKGEERTGSHD